MASFYLGMATFFLGMATFFLGLATFFLGIQFFQNGYILVPHQKKTVTCCLWDKDRPSDRYDFPRHLVVWEILTNVWEILTNVWEILTNVWEIPI